MRAEIKLFVINIGIDNLIIPAQGTSKGIIERDDEKTEGLLSECQPEVHI